MQDLSAKMLADEKRAFKRVPIAIAGKVFFPHSDAEQSCIVTDISLGGATLQCDVQPAVGTELVLYLHLPGFDRYPGVIVRSNDEEAGMLFEVSEARRERVAAKIMLHIAGVEPEKTETRRAERLAVPRRSFTRPSGQLVHFEVRDISLTGASLKTAARPPIGEIVMVGTTPGRITRHFDEGIALEFVRLG